MDTFDKAILGFCIFWIALFSAVVLRCLYDKKPVPKQLLLNWLLFLFMTAFFFVEHHPGFQHSYPFAGGLLWLGWIACGVGSYWLSRKAKQPEA